MIKIEPITNRNNFVKIYCITLIVASLIFIIRYGNFLISMNGGLDDDFGVYYRAASNVFFHVSPYYDSQTSYYYPYLYPPFFNIILYPLAQFPYLTALTLWLILGIASFYYSLILFTKNWQLSSFDKFILYALTLPYVTNIFLCGQTGLFTSAILLSGFAIIKKHQYFAGGILALIIFKPQLAIILPLVFIAQKNYRSLLAFAVVLVLTILLSLWINGSERWLEYLAMMYRHSLVIASNPTKLFRQMTGIFVGMKILGFSNFIAIMIHCTIALAALSICCWQFWRSNKSAILVLFVGMYMISPYIFVYDTALLPVVLYHLAKNASASIFNRLAFIIGGFQPLVNGQLHSFGIPYGAISLALIFYAINRQADQDQFKIN